MKVMDIGEVASASGVPPSTLRYYDEIGLVPSIGRKGLRRQYGPDALLQLTLISLGKMAGFSLDEISGMFGRNGAADLPRAALHERAEALDRQVRDLAALRDMVRHVADCPAPSHLECPRFRKLVRIAGRGVSSPRSSS
ncbi:helix-turn-helix domain-containing protein [Seohaeicola zhoushanensis]|uniref:MerR family transcriptional regulator n=1 Tax=Seohaeicola zhoushanensis TaxID=1569283 RepID=A0A8J3GVV6_9RHOB|nr:helix-turn-helix domain-containing protein [Seohaeicola zhoushanensis]GHF41051.1 MerR family transcriptional regulator [Seohaeicola zhoushanensis]